MDLHALTAQVRKFMLSTFIFSFVLFVFPLIFIDGMVILCQTLYNLVSVSERLSTRNFAGKSVLLYSTLTLTLRLYGVHLYVGPEVGIFFKEWPSVCDHSRLYGVVYYYLQLRFCTKLTSLC